MKGTPQGDVVLPAEFKLKDGKVNGTITNPKTMQEVEMTGIEIKGDQLTANFQMEGYDLPLVISKKDDNHANGKVMGMFDTEATRKAASDNYFLGKWDMLVKDIPDRGNVHMPVVFELKKDSTGKQQMIGHIEKTATDEEVIFSKVEPAPEKISFNFTAQGYDINVVLTKKDADIAEGKMFDMFSAVATRVKK